MLKNTKSTSKNIVKITAFDDFKQLTKIGLSMSVVFSSVAGYLLAVDTIDWKTLSLLAIGGYFMVGASNAYNQIIEKDTDALMLRTQNRPIPTGRMSAQTAFIIAVIMTILGIGILYSINQKVALFGAISIFLYTSAYTPLKSITPFSVFVGAISGAIPYMLGWVAATNDFSIEPGILFLIQFFWQFPHFWAIGWFNYEEYKKAGFNMLPTRLKDTNTIRQIILYIISMMLVSVLPVLHKTGSFYIYPITAVIVFLLGGTMLFYAIRLYQNKTDKTARHLMLASVFYITLLQIIYIVDKYFH